MTDPLPAAVTAVLHGDAGRLPIVALAGAVSSIGPCAAPRYVALATLLTGERRGLTIGAFVAGLMTAYAALGFGAGLLELVAQSAAALDAVLAAVLVAGGLVTLLRTPACDHAHAPAARKPRRLSGVFALGAASALVVSPCCTPMVAAVAAFPGIDASPLVRAAMLGVFALGHALPIVLLGAAGTLFATRLRRWTTGPAPAVVSGSLMLALGAYYGLLV